METIIYHIDVNSAFLSWEASYRLNILGETSDLRLVPSVVGGNQASRHGIVLAKSIPAGRLGIKTGEPLVSAKEKCPNLLICPPNYPMYDNASRALTTLLSEYTPEIHQYSIDESFCNMTGTTRLFGSPLAAAELIKERIKQELGFTVNIGISNNKLLAKMASDFQKPDRIHTLFPCEIKDKMWPLPVGDLFFVGHATERKLLNYGIRTIGELAACNEAWIKKNLGAHGRLVWQFANGDARQIDRFTLCPVNKGYGNSITVPYDVTDTATAHAVILSLTETVAARIRADSALISIVSISIVDYNFMHCGHQEKLTSPTNITRKIYETACRLFDEIWSGIPIRQLGVHTSGAQPYDSYQYSLFDNCNIEKEMRLDTAIDKIRNVWGEDAIIRGTLSTLVAPKAKRSRITNKRID